MTLRKFQVGDPFRPSKSMLDAWTDAANTNRGRRVNTTRNPLHEPLDPDTIWIRNDSGAAREWFDVLAFNGPLIHPDANEAEFLIDGRAIGITPQAITNATTHVGEWALLLEPAAEADIITAAVSGIWPCIVDCNYPTHRWADVAHGSHALTSNWYGCGQILWHESWDAESWSPGPGKAFVRLSNFRDEILDAKVADTGGGCPTTSGIARNSSGLVDIWEDDAITEPLQRVTAHYRWITPAAVLPIGTKLRIKYSRRKHRWDIVDHECV